MLFISSKGFAQNFTRDMGIRGGDGAFFTYRHFSDEEKALEGMAGFSKNSLRVVILREYLQPFKYVRSENVKLIYGFGMHAGITYTNKYKILFRTYYQEWQWSPQLGVDGLIGFEYTFPEFPLLIRLAAQPYFEFSTNRYFQVNPFNIAVSVVYRF
jgi:hypothetical protein